MIAFQGALSQLRFCVHKELLMYQIKRQIFFLVALVLTLLLTLVSGVAPAHAQKAPVPVQGTIIVCFPPAFPCEIGETKGTTVGQNYIAERPLRMYIFTNSGANGFEGTVDVKERVVRKGRDNNPFFTFKATQLFTGKVRIDNQVYEGTLTQSLQAKGLLNPNLPLDDPAQGASTLDGAWTIVGQGTGALQKIRGNGTLTWPGGAVPVNYEGKISL